MADPAAPRRSTFLDRKRHAFLLLFTVFGGGLLAGVILAKFRPPPELSRPPATASRPIYSTTNPLALRAGEEIELTRADPSDPDSERVRTMKIDPDGGIRLPVIGPIMAQGLTPEQLEQAIAQVYRDKDLVQNAKVKVVRKTPATTAPAK